MTNERSNRNHILSGIPALEYARLAGHLEPVALRAGDVLYAPGQPIQYVHFPETAVVSLLNVVETGTAIETSVVGREGIVGLPVFHGVPFPTDQALVRCDGTATRMRAAVFAVAAESNPELQRRIHRFAQAQLTMTSQSSACNRKHSVEQRCARWLLIAHDRAESDEFELTHLFLSRMLGVRRSSVTVAAEHLRKAGAIEYKRGRVAVVDRERLEELSCECYGVIRSAYDLLLHGAERTGDAGLPTATPARASLLSTSLPNGALLSAFSAEVRSLRARADSLTGATASVGDAEHLAQLALVASDMLARLDAADEALQAQFEALGALRYSLEFRDQERRQFIESLPDAFVETDLDGAISDVNQAAESLLGRPRHHLLGVPFLTLIDQEDRGSVNTLLRTIPDRGTTGRWSGRVVQREAGGSHSVLVDGSAVPRATDAESTVVRWLLRRHEGPSPAAP